MAKIDGEVVKRGKRTETIDSVDKVAETEPKRFNGTPAQVTYSRGATINLGQYNSKRVSVSITMPCNPDEVSETLQDTIHEVDNRIESLINNRDVVDNSVVSFLGDK
jgi:hypothetical protein